MEKFLELAISSIILLSFIFIFLFYSSNLYLEDYEIIKLKIYNVLNSYNLEIRNYAFLGKTTEIENILKNELPKIYDFKVLICYEKNYDECFKNIKFNANNVFSVSYFFSSNFTNYENIELIIYAWKKI
ncbi:MAG: hypothetical protein QXW35_00645 [Candidatus Aenigmatarchaeota archaeon]